MDLTDDIVYQDFSFSLSLAASTWTYKQVSNNIALSGYTPISCSVNRSDVYIAANQGLCMAQMFQLSQLFIHAYYPSAVTISGFVRVCYKKI